MMVLPCNYVMILISCLLVDIIIGSNQKLVWSLSPVSKKMNTLLNKIKNDSEFNSDKNWKPVLTIILFCKWSSFIFLVILLL